MNTPTHTLLALALLSKGKGHHPSPTSRNWAVFIGSLIPDLAVFLWAPYQRYINGVGGRELWRELYFEAPMQLMIAPANSLPLVALLALIGAYMRKSKIGLILLFGALAALVHIATDFPIHTHDAYRHFWPFSEWRFHSPFSYWQRSHHGHWVSAVETLIAIACIVALWKRFAQRWVKVALSLSALFYVVLQYGMWLAPHGPPA